MRYEVLVGLSDDPYLSWTKTLVTEADDELTAAYRAGAEIGLLGYSTHVLAIRSEAGFHHGG